MARWRHIARVCKRRAGAGTYANTLRRYTCAFARSREREKVYGYIERERERDGSGSRALTRDSTAIYDCKRSRLVCHAPLVTRGMPLPSPSWALSRGGSSLAYMIRVCVCLRLAPALERGFSAES